MAAALICGISLAATSCSKSDDDDVLTPPVQPEEAVETYKATPMWKDFNVQPLAGTGISISEEFRVKSEECNATLSGREFATAPGWYSLDGRRLDGKPAQSGIYVNGERKVVIK